MQGVGEERGNQIWRVAGTAGCVSFHGSVILAADPSLSVALLLSPSLRCAAYYSEREVPTSFFCRLTMNKMI